ncbi:MAG: hypothetical protein ABIH23_10370 [bacterium]
MMKVVSKIPFRSPLTYAFIAVGLLRFYYCFEVPVYTTDLFRNLAYGREFWHIGPQIYSVMPEDFAPEPYQFFWSTHGYTYPAATLGFFCLIAPICPGILHGKILLTLLSLFNTWMVYRITRDRWTAFLFWANPIAIWYGSHEGQFEPYVSTWMILGVWLLRRRSPWAMFCLAMGIQAKLFPVFLVPTFFLTDWRRPARRWALDIAFFVVGFLPSIALALSGDYLIKLLSPAYIPRINHIPWKIDDLKDFRPQPVWLIYLNAAVSKGTLLLLILLSYSRFRALKQEVTTKTGQMMDSILDYAPAFLFLCLLKSSPLTQFWHLMLLPAFAMTIQDRRHRRILFIMACLFGGRSLYTMLIGPFGDRNPSETMQVLSICFYRF